MKLGLIREGKTPPDSRVPLSPQQVKQILDTRPCEIVIQPSPTRCYSDQEYLDLGLTLQEDLSDCNVLLGVKEVPIDQLIADKTYFFFSHTIKEQAYNRPLLQNILQKNIRLIDYEVLTDESGKRLIAFGRFAGMVGAHNALYTYGQRTGAFALKRMKDCYDYAEAKSIYQKMEWPALKIVLTGTGRVGSGAAEVLSDMGIRSVTPEAFLQESYDEAVFTQLQLNHYAKHGKGETFSKQEFYQHPERFVSAFAPYTKVSDIFINGIYWDNLAPAFFTKEEMGAPDFSIQVIADVTCDIAPVSSIPSTLKASTIADPIFGFDPQTGQETAPHQEGVIDMMTIDNLPNEMPRDASQSFGQQFIHEIMDELFFQGSEILEDATVARAGELGPKFQYLQQYVSGL
ncbi:MAG: NAD(P)-dependent oxidoreductase [Bacteroidota bacterium]